MGSLMGRPAGERTEREYAPRPPPRSVINSDIGNGTGAAHYTSVSSVSHVRPPRPMDAERQIDIGHYMVDQGLSLLLAGGGISESQLRHVKNILEGVTEI